jgi:hypothetical protein
MSCLVVVLSVLALLLLLSTQTGRGDRHRGPSWFDILPHLHQSKKRSGRVQQKRKQR